VGAVESEGGDSDEAWCNALMQLDALRAVLEDLLDEGAASARNGMAALLGFANAEAAVVPVRSSASKEESAIEGASAMDDASAPAAPAMSMANVAMVAEVSAVLGGDTRKASYFLTMTDWASAAVAINAAFAGTLC
jgi:hypothetical protein